MALRGFVALAGCAALLSGCGGGVASSPAAPSAAAVRNATSGNIYWSKGKLRLPYPAHGAKRVVLTYWGPDGYFTEPIYCQNGSNIAVSHGKPSGKSSGYQHVVFSFRAKSAGPDTCSYDAVLNNTGSPPIAILHLIVAR